MKTGHTSGGFTVITPPKKKHKNKRNHCHPTLYKIKRKKVSQEKEPMSQEKNKQTKSQCCARPRKSKEKKRKRQSSQKSKRKKKKNQRLPPKKRPMLPRKAIGGIFFHLTNHTLSLSFLPSLGRKPFGGPRDKTPGPHHIFFLSPF